MSNRFYNFDEDPREYVSVTTFLDIIHKPFLAPWYAKMERELLRKLMDAGANIEKLKEYIQPKQPYGYKLYMEATADFGKNVHRAIDYTLKDLKLPKLTKDEKKAYDKWKEWWSAQKFKLLGAEKVVRSRKHGYAGTEDCLYEPKPMHLPGIIDWKTGKSFYPEHYWQNLAYQAAEEEEGTPVGGGLLVYVPREGNKGITTKDVPHVTDELLALPLAALDLWRRVNNKPWKEVGI